VDWTYLRILEVMDVLDVSTLLQIAVCGYIAGIVAGLLCLKNNRWAGIFSFGISSVSAVFGIVASVTFLLSGAAAPSMRLLPSLLPYVEISIRLDPLSAFFVLVVSSLALAISIFSIGYAAGFKKNAGLLGAFYNALLLATTLVVMADNAFFFLIAWEIMALTAYCLVSFEHEKAEARNAGVLYFIMSHIGTGCLILGFLLLFQVSGNYSFAGFHALGDQMSAGKRNAAFLLFMVGFGVKAGIVPLHIWLPAAHPVAPSNVSALLSSVLIKTGIYGMTRVFFDFLGAPPM